MSTTGEAIKEFFTQDIFPGMSMWAFLLIVVSAVVFLIVAALFIRIRRQQRKKEWSDVLYNEKQRKKYASKKIKGARPRPKFNGKENIAYNHDEQGPREDKTEDSLPLYAQPIKTSVRNANIVKEPLPLAGEINSSGLYAQPFHNSEIKVTKVDEQNDGNEDEYEDDLSALYARPFNTFRPIEKPNTNEDPENSKGKLEVQHESAPDNPDVLYAVSMKRSSQIGSQIHQKEEESDAEARSLDSDTDFEANNKVPETNNPGDKDQSHEKDEEEVDLSAVAMAEMSTGDDVESTEL